MGWIHENDRFEHMFGVTHKLHLCWGLDDVGSLLPFALLLTTCISMRDYLVRDAISANQTRHSTKRVGKQPMGESTTQLSKREQLRMAAVPTRNLSQQLRHTPA